VKILLAAAVVALVAACSHAQIDAGGSTGLQARSDSRGLATAVIAVGLAAGAIDYSREPRPFPSPAALLPERTPPAPALAPDRRISEQDCTKPFDPFTGNLRCK
jgi:hypothetical protein